MEHRIFIYLDVVGDEIAKVSHDNSIINSLPRVGDVIIDIVKLNSHENECLLRAKVSAVVFDYDMGIVTICAEVLKTA